MKKIIQTILLLSLTFFCKGQTLKVPVFIDQRIITSKVDSLFKSNVTDVIVIQSTNEFENIKSNDSLLTFICWCNNDKYYVIIVSENSIYATTEFNGKQIFDFSNKEKTFVTKDEQNLKFIPPLTNQNVVFYISKSSQGYFEQPDKMNDSPTTYSPSDQTKEKLRKEWFTIIYQTLYNENFNIKIDSSYDRYKELE